MESTKISQYTIYRIEHWDWVVWWLWVRLVVPQNGDLSQQNLIFKKSHSVGRLNRTGLHFAFFIFFLCQLQHSMHITVQITAMKIPPTPAAIVMINQRVSSEQIKYKKCNKRLISSMVFFYFNWGSILVMDLEFQKCWPIFS